MVLEPTDGFLSAFAIGNAEMSRDVSTVTKWRSANLVWLHDFSQNPQWILPYD